MAYYNMMLTQLSICLTDCMLRWDDFVMTSWHCKSPDLPKVSPINEHIPKPIICLYWNCHRRHHHHYHDHHFYWLLILDWINTFLWSLSPVQFRSISKSIPIKRTYLSTYHTHYYWNAASMPAPRICIMILFLLNSPERMIQLHGNWSVRTNPLRKNITWGRCILGNFSNPYLKYESREI